MMKPIPFNNLYQQLGEAFFRPALPTPVAGPILIRFNDALAAELGLPGDWTAQQMAEIFSGNRVPEGAAPLAMAYSGHQFGYFNPQMGDGRAILLGEVLAPGGRHVEIQLKGAGRTSYSRDGDGRAALGPVLREYLVSEAMARLGVPTTRALAAVATGEPVRRERILPGGVITRTATSFVRVGTFQHFAARGDIDSIRKLADHVIDRRYPEARDAANPYRALLSAVVEAQAGLIAQWMQLGFIHGVMNTDNMSVAGETIDYGPCAFMDTYEHAKVYSSIDQHGRYAYNEQPSIGLWNLTRLAESLAPLLDDDTNTAVNIAREILGSFIESYEANWLSGMRAKCGLTSTAEGSTNDKALIDELFDLMAAGRADFTLTFSALSELANETSARDKAFTESFDEPAQADAWLIKWRARLQAERVEDSERRQAMRSVNPLVIPRNHRIEAAIRAAEDHGDLSLFHDLHEVLQSPYRLLPGKEDYRLPPTPDEVVCQTFCGT